ncbi:NfeD family protein [Roseomonas sp. USHLN139]|uniref:NfeD family protein n=1 Tax=Roseomonas sp. USHLN139 TaxID=3081298 RepID=UPI003B023928
MTFEPWVLWLGGGLLLMAADLLIPGIFLVWVGAAAVGTGLLVLLADPGFPVLVIVYIALLALGIFLSVRCFRPVPRPGGVNSPSSGLVGRPGLWQGAGRVRVGDSDWPARSGEALLPGSPVRVVAVEGMVLVVEPA